MPLQSSLGQNTSTRRREIQEEFHSGGEIIYAKKHFWPKILEVPVHAESSGMGFPWQPGSPSTHMCYTGKMCCSLSSITHLTRALLPAHLRTAPAPAAPSTLQAERCCLSSFPFFPFFTLSNSTHISGKLLKTSRPTLEHH